MKLPEDRTERVKILVLIALGAVAAVYTVAIGIVKPIKTKRKERGDEIAVVQEQLQEADREIGRMMKNRKENTRILKEIIAIANEQKSVLEPRLGNYLLEARDYLEAHARTADVKIESIREVGVMQLPKPKTQINDSAIKAYNGQVSIKGGIHELIRFLRQIEMSNPYIVVSSLTINSSGRSPDKHTITFDLQWPVWAEAGLGKKLEDRMKEMMDFDASGGRPKAPSKKKT